MRQGWLRVLALATHEELESAWANLPAQPTFEFLRPPETGLVMIRGRIGGSGKPFNLGEMTVTRCTVRLADGVAGTGFVAGTDRRRAELVALFDALMQDDKRRAPLKIAVIEPLAAAITARQLRHAEKAAETRVDFFTMVRGDG